VLFDINRLAKGTAIIKNDPKPYLDSLFGNADLSYILNLLTNANEESLAVQILRKEVGTTEIIAAPLDTEWPNRVHSLAHVSLPFPATDPLYGENSSGDNPGVRLGNIALQGEKGVLRIPAAAMLRLRWNPFYPYIEKRILNFVRLGRP
jgi:hypothetical protein